ncbi:MAG: hypothetical protein OZ921_13185 [Sorangiineae bacterium]|nr:hypothetical protein [Polyangiaceae bacterium]MEB2323459.1 hypothetical protein [Sorangiineae bacterium]
MRWLRGVALGLMLAVIAFAALTARAVRDGRRELEASDAAFDQGHLREAMDHARRAAVLYAPGAPHVDAAYARLIAIATGAEATGRPRIAEMAWRAVRGAALETRTLVILRRAELERANANLARLAARAQAAAAGGPEDSDRLGADERRALAELGRDTAPRGEWVLVLGLGFVLSALGLGLLGMRAVGPGGELIAERSRAGLVVTLVGVACWLLAVWQA